MRTLLFHQTCRTLRLGALTLAVGMTPCVSAISQTQPERHAPIQARPAPSQPDQPPSERLWIAGRYDGNRIIVYFDAVKFEGALSSISHEIAPPIATGFFSPVGVPETFAARFQNGPNAEHFSVGDKYDLLLGNGMVATLTLTTLVAAETDEEVGNDSFLGALATLSKEDASFMLLARDYYVLSRHHETVSNGDKEKLPPNPKAVYAYLEEGPVRFGIQTRIVDLLTQRMKALATDAQLHAAERTSPEVEVQAFHLPDGSLRYYASAEWYSGIEINDTTSYSVAAWIAPQPILHILAPEPRTFGYAYDEPKLRNVVDLGGGRIGVIVTIAPGESIETNLIEYRDGVDLKHMRLLQSIAAGE